MDEADLQGFFIFALEDLEQAEEPCNTKPAVKAGILCIERIPWCDSAALMRINVLHQRIVKKLI